MRRTTRRWVRARARTEFISTRPLLAAVGTTPLMRVFGVCFSVHRYHTSSICGASLALQPTTSSTTSSSSQMRLAILGMR